MNPDTEYTSEVPRQYYHTFTARPDLPEDTFSHPPSSTNPSTSSPNSLASTFSTSLQSPSPYTSLEHHNGNYFTSSFGNTFSRTDPSSTLYSHEALDAADLRPPSGPGSNIYYHEANYYESSVDGQHSNGLRASAPARQTRMVATAWQISPTLQAPSLVSNPRFESHDGVELRELSWTWDGQDGSDNFSSHGTAPDEPSRRTSLSTEQSNLQQHDISVLTDDPIPSKLQTADLSRNSTYTAQPKPNTTRSNRKGKHRTQSDNHNQVEKQYRTRLNNHFAQLLARIPTEMFEGDGLLERGAGNVVSKAETLMMAGQYIKRLEVEEKVLRGENNQLAEDFENLREEWLRQGGTLMP